VVTHWTRDRYVSNSMLGGGNLLHGVASSTCANRSSPGYCEYLMSSNRAKQ